MTRRVFLWGLLGLIALVAAAWGALQTEAARKYALDELTELLNRKLAGEVAVERVTGSLLWGATLHDFELRDGRGNSVLRVDEVDTTYALVTLLRGDLVFGRVELERPEFVVRRYDDGTLNLSTLAEPKGPDEPPPERGPERDKLQIYRLVVSDGTLHYEDETFEDVDARANLFVSTHGAVRSSIDSLGFNTSAGPLERSVSVVVDTASVDVRAGEVRFASDEVVVAEDSRFDDIRFSRKPSGEDADQNGSSHLAGEVERMKIAPTLALALSGDTALTSPVEATLTFEGPADNLGVYAQAKVAGGGEIDLRGAFERPASTLDLEVRADSLAPAAWVDMDAEDIAVGVFEGDLHVGLTEQRPVDYTLTGSARGVRVEGRTAERADFDLTGKWVRGAPGADEGLQRLTAKGTLSLRGFEADGTRARQLDSRVDFVHTPSRDTGDIRADLDRLVVDERVYGSGRVELDLEPGGKFRLDVRAVPEAAPDFPLRLDAVGVHSEAFDSFELSRFQVGGRGLLWKLRETAQIRITDEAVVIESLVLVGPGQPIRLDGTYPLDGTLAAIAERLGNAGLDALMSGKQMPAVLRDALPENLDSLTPEEIREAIPDEVEEQLSDEIKRRLRLPKF
ncbi:hypothetical protein FIV42_24955 [Persicimonas caeni]|uniref:AsmA family protein n=1 Tax=Persicimonas caeni TaxID=2292766 RepID=A0A4Y6Q033_PERCE|nr:AsmA family protein [Persicimonas caeni]QDG53873.1 hypothetical protein FIV42_24955 [Persicimonas caeni]QED35094.1 hypothetical protein FRD00_24950 [Persicimonas caeni]